MSNGTGQHPNAPFTPEGRRRMVACVLDRCWSVAATAERFQVDAKTVRKWRDRFLAEGDAGLWDRSSWPRRSPNRTPEAQRRRVLQLRRKRRWGAAHIGFEVGLAASTVQAILNASGVGRLDQGDRATHTPKLPAQRYQRERPGELIHVDVKKLGGIPSGGGGGPGDGATPVKAPRPGWSGTGTCTRLSTTGPASCTRRSSTTNKHPLLRGSGPAPPPGTNRSGFPSSGSSPTTGPVTARDCGTGHAPRPRPP